MNKNNRGFIPIIIAIILGIAIVGGGAYVYKKEKTSNDNNDSKIDVVDNKPIENGNNGSGKGDAKNDKPVKPDTGSSSPKTNTQLDTKKLDDGNVSTSTVYSVTKDNNNFALKLFSQYEIGGGNDNAFISPWSISSAIGMVYEGAGGSTKTDIAKTLEFNSKEADRKYSFARIAKILNASNSEYELNSANSIWLENSYKILNSYLDSVSKYYDTQANNVDFINKSEQSRVTINSWVEKITKNRIKDLIPPGGVDSNTRLVLTNAIYFKGKWADKFNKSDTKQADFSVEKQVQCIKAPCYPVIEKIKTDMMFRANGINTINYYEDNNLQAVDLPYKGNSLSMLVLLPKLDNGHYINIVEKLVTDKDYLEKITSSFSQSFVNIYLPKFTFTKMISLSDILSRMGMESAFSSNADFSLISGSKDLSVSGIFHKAFVAVDEEGTEAAAATAVVVGVTSVMPPQEVKTFNADHPFVFIIKDNRTHQILFIGKVNNPNLK
jgi:serpin B